MCSSLSVCILIFINVVVFLLGIAVAIFGAIAQWGRAAFSEKIVPFISKAMSSTGAGPNVQIDFKEFADLMGQYVNYLSAAGLVIFIFGLILIVMSLTGLCGACKKNKCLLYIYIVLLVILLLAMVALTLTVRFARGDLQQVGRTQLQKYIKDKFVGLDPAKANAQSAILSLIQARLSCCGVTNGTDFDMAKNWNRTYVFNSTSYTLKYPISCCKMKKGSYDVENTDCFENPTTATSNFGKGCYSMIWEMVENYSWFVIYGLIGIDVFLILLIIMSIVIIRSVSEDELKNV